MAFSIKQVKAKLQEYGVSAESLDSAAEYFCSAHRTDLDAIKEQRDTYKADAETLAAVQKELETVKVNLEAAKKDGYKEKYEALKKEFEGHKADVAAKESKAAKTAAARAYYESKGITGKALDIAMRGSGAEIDALELADGKIKDVAALEALVNGDFSGLVGEVHTDGAPIATPPVNTGGVHTMTKEQIMNIKDTAERQKAMAENSDLFGI